LPGGLARYNTPVARKSGADGLPGRAGESDGRMANVRDSLNAILETEGVLAVVLVDLTSGETLGSVGGTPETELEAAANADLMKTKERIIRTLGFADGVEDMTINTWKNVILLRRVVTEYSLGQDLMLFIKMRRVVGNEAADLATLRAKLRRVESELLV
jgi:predicted regulator of Ras-like GTPase activity (Roadblock/LC7/MglB family)